MRHLPIFFLLTLLTSPVFATPFWGDKVSQPVETDPSRLQSGQFIWKGEAAPSRPILVVVSLPEQRAYVYRNGVRIGVSSASIGKAGYNTPTGVFTVLQKDKNHLSKSYNNAPILDQETTGIAMNIINADQPTLN